MASPFLTLDGLDKHFGALHVLREISLEVVRGEVLALLGPSGSGKTTLLRLLAGFETPDAGVVRVEGEAVTPLPPSRRRFGMVFQHYALFPHLTVGENVAFGLESQGWERARIAPRVAEMLALVDLAGFEARPVSAISGGQQQRVALARALAPEPRVLLLDEPLSNLDPTLRERTRRELKEVIRRVGTTTVLVTHEQEEAFDLGDRVAVLHGGRLQQLGTPEELYEAPATRFVATFVGRASVVPGVLEAGGDGAAVRLRGRGPAWPGTLVDPLGNGDAADLVLRPEALEMRPAAAAPEVPGAVAGRVVERRYAGPVSYFLVELEEPGAGLDGLEVEVRAPSDAAHPGQEVRVRPSGRAPLARIYLPAARGGR